MYLFYYGVFVVVVVGGGGGGGGSGGGVCVCVRGCALLLPCWKSLICDTRCDAMFFWHWECHHIFLTLGMTPFFLTLGMTPCFFDTGCDTMFLILRVTPCFFDTGHDTMFFWHWVWHHVFLTPGVTPCFLPCRVSGAGPLSELWDLPAAHPASHLSLLHLSGWLLRQSVWNQHWWLCWLTLQ